MFCHLFDMIDYICAVTSAKWELRLCHAMTERDQISPEPGQTSNCDSGESTQEIHLNFL